MHGGKAAAAGLRLGAAQKSCDAVITLAVAGTENINGEIFLDAAAAPTGDHRFKQQTQITAQYTKRCRNA